MSWRWRNNFFDTHRTCQKPIESCCKPLRSESSLLRRWLRVGGKGPEATVTKQECWYGTGASNPRRSRLKRYSYGTARRIALCQAPQPVSLPRNCPIAPPFSIRETVISRFSWSTRRTFSMRSGGKLLGFDQSGRVSAAALGFRTHTRRALEALQHRGYSLAYEWRPWRTRVADGCACVSARPTKLNGWRHDIVTADGLVRPDRCRHCRRRARD